MVDKIQGGLWLWLGLSIRVIARVSSQKFGRAQNPNRIKTVSISICWKFFSSASFPRTAFATNEI